MSSKGLRAGRAFSLLALIFVITFGISVVLLSLDQQRVVDANGRLQEQTVPEIIRYQRLARNLEQLRQEGERIFAVSSVASRQQSLFVVTLIASHPSVLEHPGRHRWRGRRRGSWVMWFASPWVTTARLPRAMTNGNGWRRVSACR
jgi:hypothetical protein